MTLSYRTCVLGGSATGIAVATIFSTTPLLWIAVVTFAVCVALFVAAMTKVLFGVESYSFLHYQLTTIAVTALIYAPALDSLALALAIAQAIGRIGCASAGCCHGRVGRLRVQYVESAVLFVIAALTAIYGFAFYVVAYAIARFALEYFRDDERRHWLGVSEAQWICALSAVAIAMWQEGFAIVVATVLVAAALAGRRLGGRTAGAPAGEAPAVRPAGRRPPFIVVNGGRA